MTFLKLDNFELIKQIINNSNLYITVHDNDETIKLVADKLIGNEKLTLAIGENKLIKKYYPKSFLIESIITRSKEEKFTNFTYINNNMLKTLINNEDFKEVVDEKLYKKLVIKIEKIKKEKSKDIDDDFER